MRVSIALTVVALAGCGGAPEDPSPVFYEPPYVQKPHLASIANGAVVIERSAELGLPHSAVMPLDGDDYTSWTSPPDETEQWMIVRLPARSTVTGVGVVAGQNHSAADVVRVEGSMAGEVWREMATLQPSKPGIEVNQEISPEDVRLLRVTMSGSQQVSSLGELIVRGSASGEREAVEWEGVWRLNQRVGTFARRGAIVIGNVPFRNGHMRLIGRPRHGFMPFAWSMGHATGYGVVAASSQGEISGYWAFDAHYDWQIGESWFGRRTDASVAGEVELDRRAFALDFLRRRRAAPFFELVADDWSWARSGEATHGIETIRSIATANPEAQFRVVVYDVEGSGRARALAEAAAAAIRTTNAPLPNVDFVVAAGNLLENPPRHAQSRALYQRVDLELASSAAGNATPIVLR